MQEKEWEIAKSTSTSRQVSIIFDRTTAVCDTIVIVLRKVKDNFIVQS